MRQFVRPPKQLRFYNRCPGLCRSLSAPAGPRTFPTLSLQILHRISGPLPRLSSKVLPLVSSLGSSPFPEFETGRLPASSRTATSVRTHISGLQAFSNVQTSGLARHPDRSHPRGFHHLAAVTFTSGQRAVSLFPHSGYATHLNRATDGGGLSPPRSAALSAAPQTLRVPRQSWVYRIKLYEGLGNRVQETLPECA